MYPPFECTLTNTFVGSELLVIILFPSQGSLLTPLVLRNSKSRSPFSSNKQHGSTNANCSKSAHKCARSARLNPPPHLQFLAAHLRREGSRCGGQVQVEDVCHLLFQPVEILLSRRRNLVYPALLAEVHLLFLAHPLQIQQQLHDFWRRLRRHLPALQTLIFTKLPTLSSRYPLRKDHHNPILFLLPQRAPSPHHQNRQRNHLSFDDRLSFIRTRWA